MLENLLREAVENAFSPRALTEALAYHVDDLIDYDALAESIVDNHRDDVQQYAQEYVEDNL